MLHRLAAVAALGLGAALAAPASAETISVVFTQPDGGVTTGLYSGTVSVTVSGTGFSSGPQLNDAFYLFQGPTPIHDSQYYQLTFGISPLVPFNPAQNAVNFIVGGLPAYNPSHVYSFLLNTGVAVPTQLHFGVGDGQFSDNGGGFSVSVTAAVPEPGTWAMMLIGFAGLSFAAMRKRKAEALAA
jgi:hypothetical protein